MLSHSLRPYQMLAVLGLAASSLWASGMREARAQDQPAPAYIVAEIRVHDLDAYRGYARGMWPILERHGGRFLTIGGQAVPIEGAPPQGRVVILAFPSLERARGFLESPDYREIAPIRERSAESRAYLVEGTINSLVPPGAP